MTLENLQNGDCVMIHALCVKTLKSLSQRRRIDLIKSLKARGKDADKVSPEDRDSILLLSAYIAFSDELCQNPKKYDRFDAVCSTIYCRLMLRDPREYYEVDYTMEDMREALFHYSNTSRRLDGVDKSPILFTYERIAKMWDNSWSKYKVEPSPQRRLWENVLLSWDRDNTTVGRDAVLERRMMAFLWDFLWPEEIEDAKKDMTDTEHQWLAQLGAIEQSEQLPKQCPRDLFGAIEYYKELTGIPWWRLTEVLNISKKDTYDHKKRLWNDARKVGFTRLPRRDARLSRKQILDLSEAFHLTVPQTGALLMMAGYRLSSDDESP